MEGGTNNNPFYIDCDDPFAPAAITIDLYRRISSLGLNKPIIIACFGTDSCIGDSLGPIVGHRLGQYSQYDRPYRTYGTLKEPMSAKGLKQSIKRLEGIRRYVDGIIITVDAALGTNIGKIKIDHGPITPGNGVGNEVGSIGDLSIKGIVNSGGDRLSSLIALRATRLGLVMSLAETIHKGLFDLGNIILNHRYDKSPELFPLNRQNLFTNMVGMMYY